MFLQLPEICVVGSAQERAVFIALRVDGQTVREAGQATGVSKSQVTNLAILFQDKLAARILDLERKRLPVSKEYLELRRALLDHLHELRADFFHTLVYDAYRGETDGMLFSHEQAEFLQTEDVATSAATIWDDVARSGEWFVNFLDARIKAKLLADPKNRDASKS